VFSSIRKFASSATTMWFHQIKWCFHWPSMVATYGPGDNNKAWRWCQRRSFSRIANIWCSHLWMLGIAWRCICLVLDDVLHGLNSVKHYGGGPRPFQRCSRRNKRETNEALQETMEEINEACQLCGYLGGNSLHLRGIKIWTSSWDCNGHDE
jgi:hypothetical protein